MLKNKIRFLFIMISLISCQLEGKKKSYLQIQHKENITLRSITCSLKTLDGEFKIYKIEKDSIYFFDKSRIIKSEDYKKIINPPKIVLNKGRKIGCGVCVDEVDYIFSFDYQSNRVIWEIQPNSKLPEEVKNYFDLLISKYNECLNT